MEILSSLKEFELRMEGLWIESDEYDYLQKEFFQTLKSWENYDQYHGMIYGKISEVFLLDNKDWLFSD